MNREMEYVYTIYQCGSISRAAQKLFVSQPALSSAVKKLENELGAPLFDRRKKPLRLTPAGEFYIQCAEKIASIQMDIDEYFKSLSGRRSVINIGSSSFFCAHVLPKLALDFQEKYPSYSVELYEASALALADKLVLGLIDFALTGELLESKQIRSLPYEQEHIVLAVPAVFPINHELSRYSLSFEDVRSKRYLDDRYDAVGLEVFRKEQFLLLKQGNELYQRAVNMCQRKGFFPNIKMRLDQILTSYYVACDGGGIAFIRDAILPYIAPTDRLCFYKIDDPLATRYSYLSYRRDIEEAASSRDFLTFLGLPRENK